MNAAINRVLKNCASRRDPALCGFCKCSHIFEYAALYKTPHALADGLMLVFEHPIKARRVRRALIGRFNFIFLWERLPAAIP
jgi:hypothetical protein